MMHQVSFLMGISPRSGMPYAALNRKEIAALWLEIRDLFMKIDADRNKGSRLTGIKVSIGSGDDKEKIFRRDLGDAVCFGGVRDICLRLSTLVKRGGSTPGGRTPGVTPRP